MTGILIAAMVAVLIVCAVKIVSRPKCEHCGSMSLKKVRGRDCWEHDIYICSDCGYNTRG